MEEKSIPVITINRECGAGGRSLAAILSEKLSIPYYDQDFVDKTVQESGYDEEDVKREGEEMSKPSQVLNNILNSSVSYQSSHDAIYNAEKRVILKLAEKPCIMVGRCANRILDEAGVDNVSIYLHAPLEYRLKWSEEHLGEDERANPEKFLEKHDSQRRTYYKQYTGYELYDASNYTFCFDVGKVSIQHCAEIVLDMLERS
jgi:cytidylate kinase